MTLLDVYLIGFGIDAIRWGRRIYRDPRYVARGHKVLGREPGPIMMAMVVPLMALVWPIELAKDVVLWLRIGAWWMLGRALRVRPNQRNDREPRT